MRRLIVLNQLKLHVTAWVYAELILTADHVPLCLRDYTIMGLTALWPVSDSNSLAMIIMPLCDARLSKNWQNASNKSTSTVARYARLCFLP